MKTLDSNNSKQQQTKSTTNKHKDKVRQVRDKLRFRPKIKKPLQSKPCGSGPSQNAKDKTCGSPETLQAEIPNYYVDSQNLLED